MTRQATQQRVSGRAGAADQVRASLVEAAARLIATEGAPALTLRRVADEVGTSTMSIYTRFGSKPELRHAVREAGFTRLAAALSEVARTVDTVADVAALGLAYYRNGASNSDLYRVMFIEEPLDSADAAIGWDTFDTLVAGVARAREAGRFTRGEPSDLARQLWVLAHGVVSLELARMITAEEALASLGLSAPALFVSFGDDPKAASRSLSAALRRAPSLAVASAPAAASGRR